MANFLNRLAARALGAAPLAEPIIPTRFGTDPASHTSLLLEPFAQPAPARDDAFKESFEGRSAPPHLQETVGGFDNGVERAAFPFEDGDNSAHALLMDTSRAPLHRQPSLHRRFAEPQTVQPAVERSALRTGDLALMSTTEATANFADRNFADRNFVDRNKEAPSPIAAAFAEPRRALQPMPPAEAARPAAMRDEHVVSQFNPAPPTPVRISIGRIEVRAEISSPPPTAPARRARPATLSLDQFLGQAGRAR